MSLLQKRPGAADEAVEWYRVARASDWASLADVRRDCPDADLVGHILIFNLCHNRYRLIVRASFRTKALFVKAVLTQKEYDRQGWKRWA
jgi:mRNA interferase HigB